MKTLLLTALFAPCCIWGCSQCPENAYDCPVMKRQEACPLVEYEGHLWTAIMLEHHSECGCGWDDDEERIFTVEEIGLSSGGDVPSNQYMPENGNEGNGYEPYRKFRAEHGKEVSER